jgi:hypothetical protein
MGHLRWTPPKEGWIKLNTNVAFLVNMGEPSADIIAWNAAGERCYYLRGEPYVLQLSRGSRGMSGRNSADGGMDQTTYPCRIRLCESYSSHGEEKSSKIELGRYPIGDPSGL